jgi:hypothetical protein
MYSTFTVPKVVCGFLIVDRVCTSTNSFLKSPSWKCCDYLMPLVGSDLFISDPDDVHENTRVCESYLRSHVLRDPWSGMQSDSLPN